ncbi:MAG: AMP-binding protein, partial [Acidimicrobiales bacterium]
MVAEPSYASGASEVPLLGETIPGNFARNVAALGECEALVDCPSGRRWTYAELDADVDTAARALLSSGVQKGDRVGIWAPNCPEWVIVQLATARIGAIL